MEEASGAGLAGNFDLLVRQITGFLARDLATGSRQSLTIARPAIVSSISEGSDPGLHRLIDLGRGDRGGPDSP